MSAQPPALREEDYETIEAAVMETGRGRWFLGEYARRNRSSDTHIVLDAVAKLETALSKKLSAPAAAPSHASPDIEDMSEAVTRLYDDLAKLRHENETQNPSYSDIQLESAVGSMQQTIHRILNSAEDIQETAWALREIGTNTEFCDRLDRNATDIQNSCSLQNLSGQRISKIVSTLQYIEKRLKKLNNETEAPANSGVEMFLLNGPLLQRQGLEQNDADDILQDVYLEDDVQVMAPASYSVQASIAKKSEPKQMPDDDKSDFSHPISSLPFIQEALANEWSGPVTYDDEEAQDINQSLNLAKLDFSSFSFEENLALFS